jgi:hypothetical protein
MPAGECRSGGECYNFCLNRFKYFIAPCQLFDASDNWLRWPGLQWAAVPGGREIVSIRLALGGRLTGWQTRITALFSFFD